MNIPKWYIRTTWKAARRARLTKRDTLRLYKTPLDKMTAWSDELIKQAEAAGQPVFRYCAEQLGIPEGT